MQENDSIQNPHDKFIKETLNEPERMAALLTHYLPQTLIRNIQWNTLKQEEITFLDEQLRERHCDLLFSAQWSQSEQICIYLVSKKPIGIGIGIAIGIERKWL